MLPRIGSILGGGYPFVSYFDTDFDCLIKMSYTAFQILSGLSVLFCFFFLLDCKLLRTEAEPVFHRIPPSTAGLNWKGVPTLHQPTGFGLRSASPAAQWRTNWDLRWGKGGSERGKPHNTVISSDSYLSCSLLQDFPEGHLGKALLSPKYWFQWKQKFPERRNHTSCPGPRGWGDEVQEPICIFSINKLELS